MNFDLTAEQGQLRETLRAFLAARNDIAVRNAVSHSELGWRDDLWTAFAEELGILGAPLPESAGGLGGGSIDVMTIMEELGANLTNEPYLETVVIAGGLLARAGNRDVDIARIVSGRARFAVAWADTANGIRLSDVTTSATASGDRWILDGSKSVVMAAPWATDLIVAARTSGRVGDRGGISAFLVDPHTPGVTLRPYYTLDGRRAADIHFESVLIERTALIGDLDGGLADMEVILDHAIAASGAEAIGVMSRLLKDTIDYVQQRRQFGQAISQFQVVQHRIVDMHMKLELAKSAVYRATLSLDADPNDRAIAASSAKVAIARALVFIGQNAVQLHGGMGMSDELAIGHYFKRAIMLACEFGDADQHLSRLAELSAYN
ncbi:acyl-CoA dehydrogenase family protein (plasmid) [Sphingobium sp. JS3065]|uniref:acyl-CoA dehydrogenase family protein n=1 Tax=Sphingobium sp. JS3065 TaxID=2970925 RepID=UPI002264065F|nr:acyl-CoA dehydrogenase family protein [Sphingobium sp. JS3065]UZW58289.1 acyl-CoA dehydrogenase family protein [Sphingobium sp. JS3065]